MPNPNPLSRPDLPCRELGVAGPLQTINNNVVLSLCCFDPDIDVSQAANLFVDTTVRPRIERMITDFWLDLASFQSPKK